MGKTYRKVPDKFLDFEDTPNKKINKQNRKRKLAAFVEDQHTKRSKKRCKNGKNFSNFS